VNLIINSQLIFGFSDTHGKHRELKVPENVDIVICAGDAVEDNLAGNEYDDFIEWFASLPCKWKVFVPGNHELSFELDKAKEITDIMKSKGITVLQDAIEDCDGVIIGSISPNITIAKEDIPKDIDILVTHYPPYGILDEGMGNTEILNFILHSQPKYHLFGHIHSTAGQKDIFGNTTCVNIATIL
jgi:Icc-related predicted phosphoesterase